MEYDITDTIANFVRGAGSNFDQQMKEQAHRLRLVSCTNPAYGRWVDVGIEFLFSALELEDGDFAVRIPALVDLNKSDRRQFRERMQDHLETCGHCALKHEYERDLNARIQETFQEHRGCLLRQLRQDGPICEN